MDTTRLGLQPSTRFRSNVAQYRVHIHLVGLCLIPNIYKLTLIAIKGTRGYSFQPNLPNCYFDSPPFGTCTKLKLELLARKSVNFQISTQDGSPYCARTTKEVATNSPWTGKCRGEPLAKKKAHTVHEMDYKRIHTMCVDQKKIGPEVLKVDSFVILIPGWHACRKKESQRKHFWVSLDGNCIHL